MMRDEVSRLERLLDRFGPALDAWPEPERTAARTLSEREPRARDLLAAAERVEYLLRATLPAEAPPRLRAKLVAIPAAHPRQERGWLAALGGARVAWGAGIAALAASALLGFALGTGELSPSVDETTIDIASVAFGPQLDLGGGP